MSSVCGIELGPDYCVLVKARRRGDALEITAAHMIEPAEWADDLSTRAAMLAQVRSELGFPRRARVIEWRLDGVGRADTASEAILSAAGFEITALISPADALGLLADARASRTGSPDSPRIWICVNPHGAAITVVHGDAMLYSQEFAWRIKASEQRVQAQLLRRYLMVAQLVPELRRAIETVRARDGVQVDSAIACGTVPDLRSLTMPLIQELDIEFETLDSTVGLAAARPAAPLVLQSPSALRLASVLAAALPEERSIGVSAWVGAAVALVVAVGSAGWGLALWSESSRRASDLAPQSPPTIGTREAAGAREPATRSPTDRLGAAQPIPASPRPQPTSGVGQQDTSDRIGGLVDAPLPEVMGILVSPERRLAVVNGAVVTVGDPVGERVVARIDVDGVVFREPSGRRVRVAVRPKRGN